MATRSIIDIEVNDDAFKRFYSLFEKFSDETAEMPQVWRQLGDAMGDSGAALKEGALSGKEALALAAAQAGVIAESIEKASKAQDTLGKATRSSNKAMDALAKSAKGVGDAISFVVGGVAKLAAFAGLGALFGGFGIGELAGAAYNRYREASGLGIRPGELASFQVNMQPYLNTNALENAANARIDVTKTAALGMLGVGPQRAAMLSTSDIAAETLKAAAKAFNQDIKAGQYPLQDPRIFWAYLQQLGGSIDDVRRAALHPREFAAAEARTRREKKALDFDDKTGQAWTELKIELDRAGFQIQTSLINNLVALSKPLERLTVDFTSFILGFINSKAFHQAVHWAADELNRFAGFLESKKFQEGFDKFIDFIGDIKWDEIGNDLKQFGAILDSLIKKLGWLVPAPAELPADLKAIGGVASGAAGTFWDDLKREVSNSPIGKLWSAVTGNGYGILGGAGAGTTLSSSDVERELNAPFTTGGGRPYGVTPAMHNEMALLAAQGYNMGVNAITEGSHSKDSAHYSGRAVDIGSLSGKQIDQLSLKEIGKFVLAALHSGATVGIGNDYRYLDKLEQGLRALGYSEGYGKKQWFEDPGPNHLHVQVDSANMPITLPNGAVLKGASPNILSVVDADIAKYRESWLQHLPKDAAALVAQAHLTAAQKAHPDTTTINRALEAILKKRTAKPAQVLVYNSTSSRIAVSANALAFG